MSEMIRSAQESLRDWMQSLGLPDGLAAIATAVIGILIALMIAMAIDRLIRWTVGSMLPKIVHRMGSMKPAQWMAALQQRLVARRSAHIVAALVLYYVIPLALDGFPETLTVFRNIIEGYLVFVATLAVTAFLGAGGDVLVDKDLPSRVSLQFATQAAQILVWVVGIVLVVSVVFDTSVTVLLSGLAGMTAVVLLIFRDSILGFVAGIQIASNDMLRIGDWIEVPQYGANGTVKDIGLTTVKVQNFDRTITTVPTYALVSGSFRNWRGMEESGARRIMRAVSVDMDRIAFLSDEMREQLRKVQLLKEYLDEKTTEIESYNDRFTESVRQPPNARRLTNIGTFRAYLEAYVRQHPDLRDDMTMIVRQLPPSPEGLPIELYVFSANQDWTEYERIQADIFDHIIAILPEFGLKAFQGPTTNEYLRGGGN